MRMTEDEVVREYSSFVEGLARKLARSLKLRISHEDLVAYGYAGLIEAWRRYDPESKAAFTSFAYYRVRGAMYDGCRKEGWASRDRKTKVSTLAAVNDHLASNQEAANEAGAARTLSESVDRVSGMVGDVITIMMVSESDLEDVLTPQEPLQDRQLERKARNAELTAALNQLDEIERVMVKRHHYYGDSLSSVAQELGLSLSWCSRIHARALEKLREILTADDLLSDTG